ncbi:MAG: MBL fold metallo-hydrolase [Clostridia bacterium]|nr:MBL fold metallo-hydrolase [Clostridia bacterium]
MKKWVTALVCIMMILFPLIGATAEAKVYVNQTPPADWSERDLLRLTVFNTTTNDAMLLECGGQTMIVDGGWQKWAGPLMRAYQAMGLIDEGGNPHVDRIFISHPHDDHVLGVIKMVERGLTSDEYITNIPEKYKDTYHQQALKLMKKNNISIHYLQQNEIIQMGNANLRVFWYSDWKDLNQASAVIHVEYGDATLLLTGDAVGAAQRGLLREVPTEYLKSDIMKVPHHAYNICVKEFLEAVDPQLTFATARQRQIPKVVSQMKARNIALLCHNLGRIVLETDGTEWYVRQYRNEF